ncbi:hypothetical protein PR048_017701 [Dryococelus australis]|uniref:Uncharacterized protein n=1 Tax=Dryococelus australis TaxID=614101 RepID=A0ABQ9HAB8_9NEOP|nr:hypothetical protein PR048_017701 [Dryococelus australis]
MTQHPGSRATSFTFQAEAASKERRSPHLHGCLRRLSLQPFAFLLNTFHKLMRVIEVNLERSRNEGAGETGDPRKNPQTNGIVRYDSHLRKFGDPAGVQNHEQSIPTRMHAHRHFMPNFSQHFPGMIFKTSECAVRQVHGAPRTAVEHSLVSDAVTRAAGFVSGRGTAILERLDCQLPIKANLVQSRAERCGWSAGFLGDLPHHQHRNAVHYFRQRQVMFAACSPTRLSSDPFTKDSVEAWLENGPPVAERLACPPPTKVIRVQSPAGSLRILACGTMPMVDMSSRGAPLSL